jgi:hypothetical protein
MAHAYAGEVQGLEEDILIILHLKLSMEGLQIHDRKQQSGNFHMAITRQRMGLEREKQRFDRTLFPVPDCAALFA